MIFFPSERLKTCTRISSAKLGNLETQVIKNLERLLGSDERPLIISVDSIIVLNSEALK